MIALVGAPAVPSAGVMAAVNHGETALPNS